MSIDLPDYCRRPSLISMFGEIASPLELTRLARYGEKLLSAPRGDGRRIILLPGYGAHDASMQPLATYLNFLGYKAKTSGLGVNTGDLDGQATELGQKLARKYEIYNEPVTLVGWSLGGLIAREIARLYENSVREVITLGTPLIGGSKYTSLGDLFARQNGIDMDAFEQELHDRSLTGLEQPLTCIYSRSDGIVGWTAAIDIYNSHARNVEVNGTHLGLCVNPKVWLTVAETIAPTRTNHSASGAPLRH